VKKLHLVERQDIFLKRKKRGRRVFLHSADCGQIGFVWTATPSTTTTTSWPRYSSSSSTARVSYSGSLSSFQGMVPRTTLVEFISSH